MTYNEIISKFREQYCPADYSGDFETMLCYITESPRGRHGAKPIEKATARRILNYAQRHGFEIYDLPLY